MDDFKTADVLTDDYFPQDYTDYTDDEYKDQNAWLRRQLPLGKQVEIRGIANSLVERKVRLANGKTEVRLLPLQVELRGTIKSVVWIEDDREPYGTALYITLSDGTVVKRSRAASRENIRKGQLKEGEKFVA